jgi:chaperonin GroES
MDISKLPQLSQGPINDRLFVIRDETPDKTGKLIIPDTDKEKPNKGLVVAAGEDCRFVFPGQTIVFGQFHGVEINLDGLDITILRENDVYAGSKRTAVFNRLSDIEATVNQ